MIDSVVKEIIEKYIKLIEQDQWDKFFEIVQEQWIPQIVGKVAETLEKSGIFPLPYMTFIPEGYFILCGISSYTIPSNIQRICYKAFYASDIEEMVVPSNVYDVGQYAFEACDFLTTITFDEGVKYISDGCFYNCDELESVFLPKSIENFGHNMFNSCNKLTQINYAGTVNMWKHIRNHEFINEGSYISRIICSDGTIEL